MSETQSTLEGDWAYEYAKNIRLKWMQSALMSGGYMALPAGHLSDMAEALRHAEATGYTRGHEAGEARQKAKVPDEADITSAMIQAGRYAANLNDGTLARIYLSMRQAETSA